MQPERWRRRRPHRGSRRPDGRTQELLTLVGDDGFKKQRIGAGLDKFVSNKPGAKADPADCRRMPSVQTLVMRCVPKPAVAP
jgi:hypothetical protein